MTTATEFRIDKHLTVEAVDNQFRLHSNSDSQLFDSIDELIESLPDDLQSAAREAYREWNAEIIDDLADEHEQDCYEDEGEAAYSNLDIAVSEGMIDYNRE